MKQLTASSLYTYNIPFYIIGLCAIRVYVYAGKSREAVLLCQSRTRQFGEFRTVLKLQLLIFSVFVDKHR